MSRSQWEKAVAAVRRNNEITGAIIEGLSKAVNLKYTKPYDTAISIMVSLEEAGYKITHIPRKKEASCEKNAG